MLLAKHLEGAGYQLIVSQYTFHLSAKPNESIVVISDCNLYADARPTYPYHEYTGWQNKLIYKFDTLLRFIESEQQADLNEFIAFLHTTIKGTCASPLTTSNNSTA